MKKLVLGVFGAFLSTSALAICHPLTELHFNVKEGLKLYVSNPEIVCTSSEKATVKCTILRGAQISSSYVTGHIAFSDDQRKYCKFEIDVARDPICQAYDLNRVYAQPISLPCTRDSLTWDIFNVG